MNEIQPIIDWVQAKYPWAATLVMVMGFARLLAKPISGWLQGMFSKLAAFVERTPETDDDEWLRRVLASVPYRVLAFIVDLILSVKLPTSDTVEVALVKAAEERRGLNVPLVLLVGLMGLAGCTLPFADQVITVKQVGDEISAEYSSLWKRGLITPEQDARAEQIHAEYRAAMAALALALETAAQTGDQSSVPAKLRAVKVAIAPLLEMVTPLLGTPTRGPTLARQLNLAVAK
jgi:hypothetical protein